MVQKLNPRDFFHEKIHAKPFFSNEVLHRPSNDPRLTEEQYSSRYRQHARRYAGNSVEKLQNSTISVH